MLSVLSTRFAVFCLVCTGLLAFLLGCRLGLAHAYTYDVQVGTVVLKAQTTGPPAIWPLLPIAITSTLGSPYDDAVASAALEWNAVVPVFTFSPSAPTVVQWAAPGELPPMMIAWTMKLLQGGQIVSATVLLDPLACWALYDGPVRATICHGAWAPLNDLARVVLHELGHVAGLDHPDEGGQVRSAIMNSQASALDTLTLDDTAGLAALYPQHTMTAGQEHRDGGGGGCTLRPDSTGVDGISVILLAAWAVRQVLRVRTRQQTKETPHVHS